MAPKANRNDEYSDVSISLSIVPFRERTRIDKLRIKLGDNYNTDYEIEIDEAERVSSLKIDGVQCLDETKPYSLIIRSASLFPDIILVNQRNVERVGLRVGSQLENVRFFDQVKNLLRPHMDLRVKAEKIDSLVVDLIASGFPDRDVIRSLGKAGPKVLTNFLNDLTTVDSRKVYEKLETILLLAALVPVVRSLSNKLKTIMGATLYIGPARARSERYYRYQDLSVSDIDPDGKNFPVFLNSLTSRQLQGLSSWVQSLFGYGISVGRERDHISINLLDGSMQSNIVDVGYGVSQILPVLGQIWWARNRPKRREPSPELTLLAIEQPELHLHPAHQALLADAFVGVVKLNADERADTARVHYVIETHSETMINRLGELVAQGRIKKDDVQIVIFEHDQEDERLTSTRTVEFDEDGALVNWPYGFFQPTV